MKNASNWLQNTLITLKDLCRQERRIGVQILELLLEVERRKAYAELKHDSLYSFCIRELQFTESQAAQRIQAMRALKSMPEIKSKIESGELSVTNVAQVQVFLRQEQVQGIRHTPAQKAKIFEQFQNKTTKEVKTQLAQMRGSPIKATLLLELDEEAEILWQEARATLAHSSQGDKLKCFKLLIRQALKKSGGARRDQRAASMLTRDAEASANNSMNHSGTNSAADRPSTPNSRARLNSDARYIAASIRREVFERDGQQCSHCGSRYALQFDHVQPFAKGGTSTAENLRLLCRNCNLLHAAHEFGLAAVRR